MPRPKGSKNKKYTGTIEKCLVCGKEFYVPKCLIKIKKYCSHQCYSENLKGKPSWNKNKKGYTNKGSFQKGHLQTNTGITHFKKSKGEKYQSKTGRWLIWINFQMRMIHSRWIAESCLKRKLIKGEIIHHINFDKSDDRPENLYLFRNQSKHRQYHGYKNKPILISNIALCQ